MICECCYRHGCSLIYTICMMLIDLYIHMLGCFQHSMCFIYTIRFYILIWHINLNITSPHWCYFKYNVAHVKACTNVPFVHGYHMLSKVITHQVFLLTATDNGYHVRGTFIQWMSYAANQDDCKIRNF